jgi:hypothetical protein
LALTKIYFPRIGSAAPFVPCASRCFLDLRLSLFRVRDEMHERLMANDGMKGSTA